MTELQKRLIKVCRALGANFTLNEKPISAEEALLDTALLPAIARRADQLSSLCLGYGIGVSFEDVEKSTLGIKVNFDDVTPEALRLLCIVDVICELMNVSQVPGVTPLDELMYD